MSDHKELRGYVTRVVALPVLQQQIAAILADYDRVKAERDKFQTALEIIGTMDTVAHPHHTSVGIARAALVKGSE